MDADPRPLTRWLTPRRLLALDTIAALAYINVLLVLAAAQSPADVPAWTRSVVVAGMGLPLAVRRLWPSPVAGAVLAASVASLALGIVHDYFTGAAFALYMVALTRSPHRSEPTAMIAGISLAGIIVLMLAGPAPADGVVTILIGTVVMGSAWTVGRAMRERRAYAALTAERMAERAVTEERLRIARELHDIVAHSMSMIAVKAGVANHVVRSRPEEAHDALRVIETTSRTALTEMRHLLGVLRSERGPDGDPADTTPAPGPSALPDLADRAAMAGVRVDLDLRGVEELPEGVGLSVYRIVQEAVTNVVRHAAPARCRVAVAAAGGEATIEVTDDGPGTGLSGDAPGYGLVGIRERVAMYGGTFTTGPRPEGGFRVSARIPYEPAGAEA